MIPNPLRGDDRALQDKKGFHNPCRVCWKFTCKNCLVFLLADFAAVLRTNAKLSNSFEAYYNHFHGLGGEKNGKGKKNRKKLKSVK